MITIAILQGQIERITGARQKISCTDGKVWVTQDGCRDDTILHPGQSLIIRTTGLTLVNAIEDATLLVDNGASESIRAHSGPVPNSTPLAATGTLAGTAGLLTGLPNHSIPR